MEYVVCFLKGLNVPYDIARRQILSMEPFPSLAKTFAIIQQQERQQASNPFLNAKALVVPQFSSNSTNWKSQSQTNTSQQKGKSKGPYHNPSYSSKNGKTCSFCGKENHTVENLLFQAWVS